MEGLSWEPMESPSPAPELRWLPWESELGRDRAVALHASHLLSWFLLEEGLQSTCNVPGPVGDMKGH